MTEEQYKRIAGAVLCEIDRRCQRVSRPIPEGEELLKELEKIIAICQTFRRDLVGELAGIDDEPRVEALIKLLKDEDCKTEGDSETT